MYLNNPYNQIIQGDCIKVMQGLPDQRVDLIVTDPPYLVNYCSRDGRNFCQNDDPDNAAWLEPASQEMYRVLKNDSYCVSFFGFTQAEKFMLAWKKAGFRPVEQLVFRKNYPSSVGKVARYHESAYLLTKGRPDEPRTILPSVLSWRYTKHIYHPTQKPIEVITPLIKAFSRHGQTVLDPFAGSGTTAVAALNTGRKFIAIELDNGYYSKAKDRIEKTEDYLYAA
jgi:site-specific DNA-methyltransferase (adenine-specific)